FDPTRAEAALEELHDVGPRTVVWLNEAQHYLGDRAVGEQVAAAVHALLIEPQRAPVLVLGTLWPKYFKQYTALPDTEEDPHSRVRELIAGRTESVPDAFDAPALAAASALAAGGDGLLADALTRARADGRLGQDLAGVPALLERYRNGSPAARALLEVAMDARRLGVGLHLPQAFLTDAAPDYFHDSDWDQLTEDWAEKAYAEVAEHVHGKQAPLRRVTPRPRRRPPGPSALTGVPTPRPRVPVFRLADYLEQHGTTSRRHRCPPASFWDAAHTHITQPDDLYSLAQAAAIRYRLQWAHHLYQRASDHGSREAWIPLADMADGREEAEILYQRAADHGNIHALVRLAKMREQKGDREGAETFYQRAAADGSTLALLRLAVMLERAGDRERAEAIAQRAADNGDTTFLVRLAEIRERAGDREGAEALAQRAANDGNPAPLVRLAEIRERAGDREGAEAIAQRAAANGNIFALVNLVEMRERAGDREGADAIAQRAAANGTNLALLRLAVMREEAGDWEGADAIAQRAAAADDGNNLALLRLAVMLERAGDREGAEAIAQSAADDGNPAPLLRLAVIREKTGDRKGAEAIAQSANEGGNPAALLRLAGMRERARDWEGADAIAHLAADDGDTFTLLRLAGMRDEAGDPEGAETIALRAADLSGASHPYLDGLLKRRWPYGLDPDGTPTGPWSAVTEVMPQVSSSPAARPLT
ncbi:hypothetical protein ACIOGT_38695, partial [Streptomyces microflavus]|uniref:SEL1-like repeat protein n=1 Tax=Streptomyces microflavus TaxID=1919 RepID=UPI00382FDDFF